MSEIEAVYLDPYLVIYVMEDWSTNQFLTHMLHKEQISEKDIEELITMVKNEWGIYLTKAYKVEWEYNINRSI